MQMPVTWDPQRRTFVRFEARIRSMRELVRVVLRTCHRQGGVNEGE